MLATRANADTEEWDVIGRASAEWIATQELKSKSKAKKARGAESSSKRGLALALALALTLTLTLSRRAPRRPRRLCSR